MTISLRVAIIADACDDHISCTVDSNGAWIVSAWSATVPVRLHPDLLAIGGSIFAHEGAGRGPRSDKRVSGTVQRHHTPTASGCVVVLLIPDQATVGGGVLRRIIDNGPLRIKK